MHGRFMQTSQVGSSQGEGLITYSCSPDYLVVRWIRDYCVKEDAPPPSHEEYLNEKWSSNFDEQYFLKYFYDSVRPKKIVVCFL